MHTKTNISIISTFNEEGMNLYGQRFLNSFSQNVDKSIKLICYAENCIPFNPDNQQIQIVSAKENLPLLKKFKKRYAKVSYANGVPPEHIRSKRPRDAHKEFKWDAIRFANKTYSIFESYKKMQDWIVWMDADIFIHSPWTYQEFKSLLPDDKWITYVGRGRSAQTWPECGFYGLNLNHDVCLKFLQDFENMYENAEDGIFKLEEWHDSFVFGYILDKYKKIDTNYVDYTADLILKTAQTGGGGHPIINCILGKWIDHLKGSRKVTKKSNRRDLTVERNEEYWKNI